MTPYRLTSRSENLSTLTYSRATNPVTTSAGEIAVSDSRPTETSPAADERSTRAPPVVGIERDTRTLYNVSTASTSAALTYVALGGRQSGICCSRRATGARCKLRSRLLRCRLAEPTASHVRSRGRAPAVRPAVATSGVGGAEVGRCTLARGGRSTGHLPRTESACPITAGAPTFRGT